MEARLEDREYLMDDYSVVDIAMVPWVEILDGFYGAGEHLDMPSFPNVQAWRRRITSRPAYQRGRKVCAKSQARS